MSQSRPHFVGETIAVVLLALLGMIIALGFMGNTYGLSHWPHWSDLTENDKTVLIACPCTGALIGALIGCCMIPTPSTDPQQPSTSQTGRPESSSMELPEYTLNGDIDLEAQTPQQPGPNTSSRVLRDFRSGNLSASVLDTDNPRVPPPSYTPYKRATNA